MTMTSKQKVQFILSVDTEEEWNWESAFPQVDYGLENICQLIPFQQFCENLGIQPTYFVDYAVLNSDSCAETIRSLLLSGQAEVGGHLHPWNNPPYYGPTSDFESHVINLPIENVRAKLVALLDLMQEKIAVKPTSFRTGRWGINGPVLGLLREYGFIADSSVIPFYKTDYFSCYDCPVEPYYPDWENPDLTSEQRELIEIPVTSGFNREDFQRCARIHTVLSRPCLQPLRLVGLAWHLGLLRKMFLSPELTQLEDMKTLCRAALNNGSPVLHMFLHSSSLIDNPNSQVANTDAYNRITQAITELLQWLGDQYELEFTTVSGYAHSMQKGMY